MPYNYPALLPLLDELFRIHRLRPTTEWRGHFANYLRTMPPYYATVIELDAVFSLYFYIFHVAIETRVNTHGSSKSRLYVGTRVAR